jgi:hypothetical protein
LFNPPPSIVYSPIEPAEFEAFLAACPQLVELDISGNKLAHTLRFSSISPKLRAFKAFWATLEIDQFIEVINAAPRIEHLQITLDLHTHPSQQDLDKFMLALPKLWHVIFFLLFNILKLVEKLIRNTFTLFPCCLYENSSCLLAIR